MFFPWLVGGGCLGELMNGRLLNAHLLNHYFLISDFISISIKKDTVWNLVIICHSAKGKGHNSSSSSLAEVYMKVKDQLVFIFVLFTT